VCVSVYVSVFTLCVNVYVLFMLSCFCGVCVCVCVCHLTGKIGQVVVRCDIKKVDHLFHTLVW